MQDLSSGESALHGYWFSYGWTAKVLGWFSKHKGFLILSLPRLFICLLSSHLSFVGEEQTFLYSHGSSGWSNSQIDVRQISKRKLPNLIHTYVWEPHVCESETPTCTRVPEVESENEYMRHQELGMRWNALGTSEDYFRMIRKADL